MKDGPWTQAPSGLIIPSNSPQESTTPSMVSKLRKLRWDLPLVISVAALLISSGSLMIQFRQETRASSEASLASAKLVTFWEVRTKEASTLIQGAKRVLRVQNKTARRLESYVIEREETKLFVNRPKLSYFAIPSPPPCSVLTFETPYDKTLNEYWVWDDSYFRLGTVAYTQRNAGRIAEQTEESKETVARNLRWDLYERFESGKIKYRVDDLENC